MYTTPPLRSTPAQSLYPSILSRSRSTSGIGPSCPRSVAPAVPVREPAGESTPASMIQRLRTSIAITAGGVVLAIIDRVIVAALDNDFHIGPIRLSWVAALVITGGVLSMMKRLLVPEEER